MKKHSLSMVFLLILTLSLISAVSASENVTCDENNLNQGELQMEINDNDELVTMSNQDYSSVCIDENPDLIGSSCDEDISVKLSIDLDDVGYENSNFVESDLIQDDSYSYDVQYLNTNFVKSDLIEDDDLLSQSVNDLNDYEIAYELTADFLKVNDLESIDELVVVSALEINNKNQNILNGITDASSGYITYNNDNLVSLSSNDSEFIAFFAKKGESITIALYDIESMTPLYYGDAGPEYSVSHVDLKSWAIGFLDNFDFTIFECVSAGLERSQSLVQTLKYYPQFEFNLPLVNTLGVSRDFNDDEFILQKSVQDESASVDVALVNKSMTGFSNLNLKSANMETLKANDLTFYEIGEKVSEKALDYFKSQGIDIQKDYPSLYVLTSAGYVKLNNLNTDNVIDGLLNRLGIGFNKTHLKTVDYLSKKDLVFYFIYSKTKTVYALKYDNSAQTSCKTKHIGSKSYISKINIGSQNMTVQVSNQTSKVNKTTNADDINLTNETSNQSVDVKIPARSNVNPFNIVYTIIAILIVCVIFGNGYRKR